MPALIGIRWSAASDDAFRTSCFMVMVVVGVVVVVVVVVVMIMWKLTLKVLSPVSVDAIAAGKKS